MICKVHKTSGTVIDDNLEYLNLDVVVDKLAFTGLDCFIPITNIMDIALPCNIDWADTVIQISDRLYQVICHKNAGGDQNHLEVYLNLLP
jgi:hypothetical protein